jgi:CDP-3, 6-dideoxy-D-glycero-L-glycero-4-hexulose-4-reductase
MNIVITGTTGFIGNAVARRICKDHTVWCTLRKTSDSSKLEDIPCNLLYVDDRESLYDRLAEIKPELVIHLAGVFLTEHNSENIGGMVDSNIDFPVVLFDAAYEAGCRQFLNTGSCWQNYQGETYNPVNLYAATKQALEEILKYYAYAKDARAITLTIFDSYGPKDTRGKILNIIARLNDGDSIGMSGGEQKMYLCYIEDIVNAYVQAIHLLHDGKAGTYAKYAVRGEQAYSLKEIVNAYLAATGKTLNISWGERAYRKREIMDPSGWGTVLPGWHIQYPLAEGMRLYALNN